MDTMKKRSRGGGEKQEDEPDFVPQVSKTRRPTTSIHTEMTALSDKQRQQILMENLLINRRIVESAPVRKRGEYCVIIK